MLVPSGAFGSPGHTADVGHDATWDVRCNEFRGLGRISKSAHNGAAVTLDAVKDFIGDFAEKLKKAPEVIRLSLLLCSQRSWRGFR
jgi:hypothetical protein